MFSRSIFCQTSPTSPISIFTSVFDRPFSRAFKGLDFTGRTVPCNPVAIHIGPNFCGDLSNNPLGGSIPITANASLVYPNDHLTALVSTTTHHSTVAFLGTAKGELKKVRFDGASFQSVIRTFLLEKL